MPGDTGSPSDLARDEFVRSFLGVDPRGIGASRAAKREVEDGDRAHPPIKVADAGHESRKEPSGTKKSDKDTSFEALNELGTRFKGLRPTYEVAAELDAYTGLFEQLMDTANDQDFAAAAKLVPKAAAALDQLEAAIKAQNVNIKDRITKRDETTKDLDGKQDQQIQSFSAEKKLELVKNLVGSGRENDQARFEMKRIYTLTDLDPEFRKADQKHQQALADTLKKDKVIINAAGQNWSKMDSGTKKTVTLSVIKQVVKAHSEELHIPVPEVVEMTKGERLKHPEVVAAFQRGDRKIHVNLSPERLKEIHGLEEVIDTAVHESAHHYQVELVAQLASKSLKPGDPLYNQALLFEANLLNPGGGVSENEPEYKLQPIERHAWETGPATAKKVMEGVGRSK